MSVNFQNLEDSLVYWWKDLLPKGASGAMLLPADGKIPFVSPTLKAHAFYSLTSVVREHHENISYDVDGVTGKLVPTISGMRHVVCSVRVDSYDQAAQKLAITLAERARTRLMLPRVVAFFREKGYSIQETRPVLSLPFPADDRIYSRAVFEVLFGYVSSETEASENASDRIDTIEIASNKLKGPDGNDAPQQISLTVTR